MRAPLRKPRLRHLFHHPPLERLADQCAVPQLVWAKRGEHTDADRVERVVSERGLDRREILRDAPALADELGQQPLDVDAADLAPIARRAADDRACQRFGGSSYGPRAAAPPVSGSSMWVLNARARLDDDHPHRPGPRCGGGDDRVHCAALALAFAGGRAARR